jgi:molybdopterin/thiamine biosynthesis adenylyltransferase
MTNTTALHSRSILAGYDPGRLQAAKVLVVGLGALGQNLVQNLALLGVGQLMLVDFDVFERHNATRSPFYPTSAEAARLGLGKAAVVAHRAAQISTALEPGIYYSDSLIQLLGDGAVSWADMVVAAVDNLTARAWLAERCRILGRPMVEGGFSGPDFNLSAFSPAPETPCYRCGRPQRESSMSCTAYALAAEAMAIVPAIQTAAAVLGGYQAEQVVQLLHGNDARLGYRSYGNVRRETLHTALLPVNPCCPGTHEPRQHIGTLRNVTPQTTLLELLAEVAQQFGRGRIQLAEPVIPATSCTKCLTPCRVRANESVWLAQPYCMGCGGPWASCDTYAPDSVSEVGTDDELSSELATTTADNLGLRAGASVTVTLEDGRTGLLRISGDILTEVSRVAPSEALSRMSRPAVLLKRGD